MPHPQQALQGHWHHHAPRYVRVTGRSERWVEFEFSIGDPQIYVELVMPPEQFQSFCAEQRAELLQ
ncbi:hypothetical protein D769_08397 [Cupriavidus sp. HMR-1]|uniref:phenol hydroxylase subunit n=1 Tax=Cupriavidus sp. HMR-1 TaxID=1249621 RepID=UPI0002A2C12A|nr:phenol hydroxylase subunit [Cupriavidus sp. HMR-1]EKZ99827.1 hypothetical protein D769_08397 [Cupriavidus sp. HMR-1]